MYGNVPARQENTLFVGVPIDGEFDEVCAYAAVVRNRVAFSRGSVSDNALALSLGLDEEIDEIPFDFSTRR